MNSSPTSYFGRLIDGPITALIRSGAAPSDFIADTVLAITPFNAPFHPACTAATTLARWSASSTGWQSAVSTETAIPGVDVTRPSTLGFTPSNEPSTIATSVECRCSPATSSAISIRSASAANILFCSTFAGSSFALCPQFSSANGPVETPPLRVKNPCGKGCNLELWKKFGVIQ